MKPVDDVEFHKIKSPREGNNYKSNKFRMDIIDEGALDKALEGPGKTLYRIKTWKIIHEVINEKYFKKSDVEFPK